MTSTVLVCGTLSCTNYEKCCNTAITKPVEQGTRVAFMMQIHTPTHTIHCAFVQLKVIAQHPLESTPSTSCAHCSSRFTRGFFIHTQHRDRRSSCRRSRLAEKGRQACYFSALYPFVPNEKRPDEDGEAPLVLYCQKTLCHDLIHVFGVEFVQSIGKTFLQTRSWCTVYFGSIPPECLRMETIDCRTVKKRHQQRKETIDMFLFFADMAKDAFTTPQCEERPPRNAGEKNQRQVLTMS